MASFDENGLQIDRLADIVADIQTDLRDTFGDGVNLAETSPWGVIIGLFSERLALLYELLEAVNNASYPNLSFGIYLDELSAFNGIIREPATFSTVDLTFQRENEITDGDVTIPAGTQASASSGSSIIWTTNSEATIGNGFETTTVRATASESGEIGALAGSINTLVQPVANVESVINNNDADKGSNEETDSELKARRTQQLGRAGTSTEQGIRSALQLMEEVETATVVTNDTDNDDSDGRPPHSFEAYVAVASGFNLGQISEVVFDAEFVNNNQIQINIDGSEIATSPVTWQGDSDSTLTAIADALVADDRINDAQADFTNNTVDIQGALSQDYAMEFIVTGGVSQANGNWSQISGHDGTLDAIAQTIWDSKAAGIQTTGEFTGTATDSSGDTHLISFSEIDPVRLWVRYTLTIDENYDQETSEAAIKEAVALYGDLVLTAGVDVLNYKLLCAASDVGSAGITDLVCENSLDGSSYASVNRTIDVSQFATIDSADVTFQYT